MTPIRAFVLGIALSGAAAAASAAPYQLEFRGKVTAIGGLTGAAVGDEIVGRLTYDDAADSSPAPTRGQYEQAGQGYQFTAGTLSRADAIERVVVFNDTALGLYNPGDGIEYQGRADGSFSTGAGTYFYVSLLGTGAALGSVALPTAAPDLAAFASRTIFWGVDSRLSPTGPFLVGELTAVSLVPEAGTPALLLAGLALLAGLRRRAHRRPA